LPDKSNFGNSAALSARSASDNCGEGRVAFTTMSIVHLSLPDKVNGDLRGCNVGVHQTYLAIVIGRCAAMS